MDILLVAINIRVNHSMIFIHQVFFDKAYLVEQFGKWIRILQLV